MARWRQQQQRRMQQRNSKLYGSCRLRQLAGVRDCGASAAQRTLRASQLLCLEGGTNYNGTGALMTRAGRQPRPGRRCASAANVAWERVVAAQRIHKRGAASWAPAERKLWRHMSTVRRASALGARASPSQLGGALLECKLVATAWTRVLRVSMVAAWPAHLRDSVMQGKLHAERGSIARKSKCVRGRASRTCACCMRTALAGARVRAGCGWQGEIPVVER